MAWEDDKRKFYHRVKKLLREKMSVLTVGRVNVMELFSPSTASYRRGSIITGR